MKFYKDECLFLNRGLVDAEKELAELRVINLGKHVGNQELTKQLLREFKKEEKYRCRRFSLETKLDNFDTEFQSVRKPRTNKSVLSQAY